MKLVEEALRHPEAERREFLKQECGSNAGDFEQALDYVEWEQRMQGFLLDPLIKRRMATSRWRRAICCKSVFGLCAKWRKAAWALCMRRG